MNGAAGHRHGPVVSGLSLVIPVRDEAATIDIVLAGIADQTRPPDEILFVDGGSRDGTIARLRDASRLDNRIRLIEAGEATPGRGRNLGITAARHDWIALTDAGIRVEPGWLEFLTTAVESDPAVRIVYGNFEPVERNLFERCASLAYVPPKHPSPCGPIRGPSIASCLIHREVWKAVGGFPELRAAEDLIFMERLTKMGVRAGFAPSATVWWYLQPTIGRTFQKFVLYSRHNALAGRARYWHYGLARIYVTALPFLALGLVHNAWWILVPVFGGLVRIMKSIWVRRKTQGLTSLLNPVQFAGVGLVMATIDVAAFLGWAQAAWQANRRRQKSSRISVRRKTDACKDGR